METVSYLALPDCIRLANNEAELIVATVLGPRILRYGFIGGDNILGEYPHLATPTKWGDWKPWGGHRLWVAPENLPSSYAPDSQPVAVEKKDPLTIRLTQQTDAAGFEKELSIHLSESGTRVDLQHRITNHTGWPLRVAPWALTILAPGGTAFMPLLPARPHNEMLLPSQQIVLWYFTDLEDNRLKFRKNYVSLTPDPAKSSPQKIGLANRSGWCAYQNARTTFFKQFSFEAEADYPDRGCNNEVYVEGSFVEVESLGPLQLLEPGQSATHSERWLAVRSDRQSFEAVADMAQASLIRNLRGYQIR